MADHVIVTAHEAILEMTINRPEARNAVDAEVAKLLAGALDRLDEDPALSVGVLTGAGGSFSSGMDLKGFLRGETPVIEGRGLGGLTEAPPRKPLIAAVEGPALGGGFEMALACDLIVAASDARFGLPEVKRSLVAGGGGLLRLPKRLPGGIAMELALTGEAIDAQRAAELGLVNRLAAPGDALRTAIELASVIAANGPLAVVASKEIVRKGYDWPEAEAWTQQMEIMAPVFASADAQEGAAAFAERRQPVWQGK